MRIGILGSGPMGEAIARRAYAAGHDVRLATRRPELRARKAGDFRVESYGDVAAAADLVFLAIPWPAVRNVVREIAPRLHRSAVLVDCTNPAPAGGLVLVSAPSAAEMIAMTAGPIPLVKALNHIHASDLLLPRRPGAPTIAFYCGSNGQAKLLVSRVLKSMGLTPLDAGNLASARQLEGASASFCELARRVSA